MTRELLRVGRPCPSSWGLPTSSEPSQGSPLTIRFETKFPNLHCPRPFGLFRMNVALSPCTFQWRQFVMRLPLWSGSVTGSYVETMCFVAVLV